MQSGVQSRSLKDEDRKNTLQWQLQTARPLRREINTKNKKKNWNTVVKYQQILDFKSRFVISDG
jgi:hypothetical protein